MKLYLMSFLLLFALKHEVVSGINQLCTFRGKTEMLFENITLDSHKQRWALYVNVSGVIQPKLVAIWGFESSSAKMDYNDNSNISMDRYKNIWINNVGEEYEGNYSIKYVVDNSDGPQVKLTVFELTEEKQFQDCHGDHPQLPWKYSAPTNENLFLAVTNGSISTTTFPGNHVYLIPTAEKSTTEINITTILVIIILIILFIAGIAWICWICRKHRTKIKCLLPRNGTEGNADKGELTLFIEKVENSSDPNKLLGEGQLQVESEKPVWKCPEITRQISVGKGGEHVENQPQTQSLSTVSICQNLTPQLDVLLQQHSSTEESKCSDEGDKELPCATSQLPVWRCNELSTKLNNLKKGAEVTDNSYICKICYEKPTRIVFMPCGHHMTCQDCAKRMNSCPLCKAEIKAMLETYSG